MWDIEVDVACIGAGPSTLASAVATTDMGATVLLATPTGDRRELRSTLAVRQRVGGFLGSWVRPNMDVQTDEYLTALSEDHCAPADSLADPRMSVRGVRPVPDGAAAAPFVGARLGAWNAACLASPYGLLFSSVSGWRTAPMRTEDGQSVEVQRVGEITAADVVGGFDATRWLRSQVSARGLEDHGFSDIERIVFEKGKIIGIELRTPDGVMSVGVRHGLALSSGDAPVLQPTRTAAPPDRLHLCIVGKSASRFLRIELLGTELPDRPLCTASGKRLHGAMRLSRSMPSGAGRCGKLR